MNNRDYKEFAEGDCYHVFNRGNGKMDIFLDDEDFVFFLSRLKESLFPLERTALSHIEGRPLKKGGYVRKALPIGSFTLIAYCLMHNHFHFLIQQKSSLSISKLISKVCTSYSMYFNKKYKRVGGLLQSKFKAVRIEDNEQLLWTSAYIHQNPKVAEIVKNIGDWQWSSYSDYSGKRQGILCNKDIILGQFKSANDYIQFVDDSFELIKERKDLNELFLD